MVQFGLVGGTKSKLFGRRGLLIFDNEGAKVVEFITEPAAMREYADAARLKRVRLALIPTMGSLHRGHLALIGQARDYGEIRVVSIFVNPTQFGPGEDFEAYPRSLERDMEICAREGVDCVFAPSAEAMYAQGPSAHVEVEGLGEKLCGRTRPGHFRGVASVVAKLFNICAPDAAVFGWKDAQQFLLLRRMASALNFPVEMVGAEIVREDDGLAFSSRNQYLSPAQRAQAPALFQGLTLAREAARGGQAKTGEELVSLTRQHIEKNSEARIDYIEAVSMDDLEPVEAIRQGNTLLALAAYFGDTRLIDNIRL